MARVAVVTGGTRGIGAAIAKALKTAGYNVAAVYAGNDEAAQKFKGETGIPVFKWDVSSYDACTTGLKQVESELGPVDVLVNNAGITRDAPFHRMKAEQWTAVINTNLSSLFNMCRPVIEGMRERKFGRIINVSSINGQKGQFGQSNYSAAKAGEIGFTKALALEGARAGITVNAIAPGYINTEMVQAVPKDVLEKSILPQIPVGRLGEPEDIARCVVFLASDDASFITGSTLSANGGQYLAYRRCCSFNIERASASVILLLEQRRKITLELLVSNNSRGLGLGCHQHVQRLWPDAVA
jgi:acetoacetyl-CoA reductase